MLTPSHPSLPSRRHVVAGLALYALAADAAHAAPVAGPAITIDNFTFSPAQLEVKPGTTVIWKNRDDIPHSVVATGKQFRSPALDTDETFSFAFTAPGTYEYFCGLHPHMHGVVVVAG
jgi:plastocyanin